jgi:8-oxo-dGTP pyrophosphatase MutT (NUDIX family)
MMDEIAGIGRYAAQDARAQQAWARIKEFVAQQGLAAFSRDPLIGGHITASAFVLSPDGGSVLLTHHRKLDIWIQLGGHCDGVADARFCALKEAYEESGLARINLLGDQILDVDIHQIPEGKEPAHLHYDIRFLMQSEAGEIAESEESHDLAWVPLSQLEQYTQEASVLRMRDLVTQRAGLTK